MTEPVVLVESPAPQVGLVRINRPDARNALNMEVRRQIVKALNEMTDNDDIRAIVLTGSDRAFAAGADIKEMRDQTNPDAMMNDFIGAGWEAVLSVKKPEIAAVAGFAVVFCASTFDFTSTLSVPVSFAAASLRRSAIMPLVSQPAEIFTICPPFAMRKLLGMVFVSKVFQLSPFGSTA